MQTQSKSTDLLCLYLYSVMQTLSLCIAMYAYWFGDVNRLAKPYDPDHHICGVDYPDHPYIYFATPHSNFLYRTVCVAECPMSNSTSITCMVNSVVKSCEVDVAVEDLSEAVLVYDTVAYKGQLCLPITQYYYKVLQGNLYPGTYQLAANNTHEARYIIMLGAIITIILSTVVVVFVERHAKLLIWTFIVFTCICTIVGGLLCLLMYVLASHPPSLPDNQTAQVNSTVLTTSADSEFMSPIVYLSLTIVLMLLTIIILILGCMAKNTIHMVTQFLKVGGDFIRSNQTILVIPFITVGVNCIYAIAWLDMQMLLYSTTQPTRQQHALPYNQIEVDAFTRYMGWYNIGMFIWTQSLFMGCGEFIISGAVSEWQIRQGNSRMTVDINPTHLATNKLHKHIGSIVFGSLVMSLMSVFNILVELIYRLSDGTLMQCYESVFLPMSKYNYVIVYCKQEHYIQSGQLASQLILQDKQTYLFVGGLGETFVLIGRVFVSSVAALICYWLVIDYPMAYVPAIISFVLYYSMATTFMDLYGMSSESIYLLYLYNKHYDTTAEPQCTVTFQRFLDQINQQELQPNLN